MPYSKGLPERLHRVHRFIAYRFEDRQSVLSDNLVSCARILRHRVPDDWLTFLLGQIGDVQSAMHVAALVRGLGVYWPKAEK